jgi:acyl-CoA reductase-like NAD-dependent aldehyde dehydrogenase
MNDSCYGLAGGVWSQDINKALRVARSAQTGTVWVNHYGPIPSGCAYGGYKNSGFYREVGKEALMHYSQIKNIYINMIENH